MLPPSRVRDFDPIYRPREGAAAPRDARVQRPHVPPRVGVQLAAATVGKSVVRSASHFSGSLVDRANKGIRTRESPRWAAGLWVHLDLVVAQQSISLLSLSIVSFVFLFFYFLIRK